MLGRALRRMAAVGRWRPRSDAILVDRESVLAPSASPDEDLEAVVAAPGAARALARARAAGVAVGVVASPNETERGGSEAAERFNARVAELVGPVDVWLECTHERRDDCPCRKPAPGLIYLAAAALGTRPKRCVVVGDTGADVDAAAAAGAKSVLVPTARTTAAEIRAAPAVASSLDEAVGMVLGKAA